MDFFLLLKIWVEILNSKIVKNLLIMLNDLLQVHLKLVQYKQSKNSRSNW